MSYAPAKNQLLEIYEGSTLDEFWDSYDDEAQLIPSDWAGWEAEAKVRLTWDSPPLLEMTYTASVSPGPTESGVSLSQATPGQIRMYAGSDLTETLDKEDFEEKQDEEGNTYWVGVWDLEIINTGTDERHRYLMGPVRFYPGVTYDA